MLAMCTAYWTEYISDASYSEPIYHYCVRDRHEGPHKCYCCEKEFD